MTNNGSILNNYDAVLESVSKSSSMKEALEGLGLRAAGGNYSALNLACKRHGIPLPKHNRLGKTRSSIPSEKIFVKDSSYTNRSLIKKRLVEEYGWKYLCMAENCPHPDPNWGGSSLTLQLDHINGVHNDHRLENLRFLCPNCHSQTDTFCGKNRMPDKICLCGKKMSRTSSQCRECFLRSPAKSGPRPKLEKIDWPPTKELIRMVQDSNYVQAGRNLGVSDNAVRKRIKTHPV